jgi:hypothetical protein
MLIERFAIEHTNLQADHTARRSGLAITRNP